MVSAVLDLEQAVTDWSADTEEDQGPAQSRAVLRGLISRLGEFAAAAGGPAEALTAVAGPLLAVRSELRARGLFQAADTIRDTLVEAGLQVRDTADGPRWTLRRP